MRTLALLAALALTTTAPRAADAGCRSDCLPWLDPVVYAMAAGMVGVYVGGTAYYVAHDLDGTGTSTNYDGSELIVHGSVGGLLLGASIDAARDGHTGAMIVTGALAGLHLTLASNGLRGLASHRSEFHPSETLVAWTLGTVTGINDMIWAAGMSHERERSWGIAEVAINAPFVAGFAYLANDRFEQGRGGPALAYAGLGALSALYMAHGVKSIVSPHQAPALDLLGTDVMPTVVSDGLEVAPGLGTSGTF